MKKVLLASLAMLLCLSIAGQQSWETGLLGGGTLFHGDLSSSRFGDIEEIGVAYGAFIRYKPRAAGLRFRLQGMSGDLVGDDLREPSGGRGFAFRTLFHEGSALLEWSFLQNGSASPRWSPYVGLGTSLLFFAPRPNFRGQNPDGPIPGEREDLSAKINSPRWTALGVLGLSYHINDRLQVNAEGNLRATFSDYIDGISKAANPDRNDWFTSATLAVVYTWGAPDDDRDGIANKVDRCPEVAGMLRFNGCPDSDGDGIPDPEDACPNQAGYLDGCPDSDTDGVPDFVDQCPYMPGPPQQAGCPTTDADADGVPDDEDKCPDRAGPASRMGCPPEDIDRDGITDDRDQCPEVAGSRAHYGCPPLKSPEAYALESLYFEEGVTELSSSQQIQLRRIASRLMSAADQLLLIQGVGSTAESLDIAQARTQEVYQYLLSWGVSKRRINFGVYLAQPHSVTDRSARRVSFRLLSP